MICEVGAHGVGRVAGGVGVGVDVMDVPVCGDFSPGAGLQRLGDREVVGPELILSAQEDWTNALAGPKGLFHSLGL